MVSARGNSSQCSGTTARPSHRPPASSSPGPQPTASGLLAQAPQFPATLGEVTGYARAGTAAWPLQVSVYFPPGPGDGSLAALPQGRQGPQFWGSGGRGPTGFPGLFPMLPPTSMPGASSPTVSARARARTHTQTPDFSLPPLGRCQTPGLSAGPRHPRSSQLNCPRTHRGSPRRGPRGSSPPWDSGASRLFASPRTELLALSTSTRASGPPASRPPTLGVGSPATAFPPSFLPAPGFPRPPESSPATPARPIGPRPVGPARSTRSSKGPLSSRPLGSHPTAPGCLRGPRGPGSPLPGAVPGAPPAQVRGGATGRPLVAGMARWGPKKGNSTQVRAAHPSCCHRKRQGPLIEHLLYAHPTLNIDVGSLSPHN